MRGARPLGRRRARVTAPPADASTAPQGTGGAARGGSPPLVVEQTGDAVAGRATDVAPSCCASCAAATTAPRRGLDLHGRARAEALRALERFFCGRARRVVAAVLVIHGRGHGSDAGGRC